MTHILLENLPQASVEAPAPGRVRERLQCGVPVEEIAHSLGGQPEDPSSPIGVIANHILALQREVDLENSVNL